MKWMEGKTYQEQKIKAVSQEEWIHKREKSFLESTRKPYWQNLSKLLIANLISILGQFTEEELDAVLKKS